MEHLDIFFSFFFFFLIFIYLGRARSWWWHAGSSLRHVFCLFFFSCGMQTLSCSMHVESSSPTRDGTRAPCIGSAESYPLDRQGNPLNGAFEDEVSGQGLWPSVLTQGPPGTKPCRINCSWRGSAGDPRLSPSPRSPKQLWEAHRAGGRARCHGRRPGGSWGARGRPFSSL